MMEKTYKGFEAGPIRPPSESGSLMLRVTRNCPWNKCKFCMLYKGEKFSIRPVEHVKADIDRVAHFVSLLRDRQEGSRLENLRSLDHGLLKADRMALFMANNWLNGGSETAFLQDANTLLMKPEQLCEIIKYLKYKFPDVQRVTSYGRSHTIAAMPDKALYDLKEAGLDRVHIGVESGSDDVLKMIRKGVDKQRHITAGQKVKSAGMELSAYYMPGLGGAEFTEQNAVETADVFNQTNPDFIRIRSLAVLEGAELAGLEAVGDFQRLSDVETATELLKFLENLKCANSYIKSDHILNLFYEIEGRVGDSVKGMKGIIERFLSMDRDEQLIYIVGRRGLVLNSLADLENPNKRREAENMVKVHNVTHDNLHEFVNDMLARFI